MIPILLLLPFAAAAQLRTGAPGSAIFTIGSGTSVSVTGNVIAMSDIAGTGTLVLNGTTIQNINMSGKQVANLKIANAAGVNMLGDGTVSSSLNLTKGILFTNNNLLIVLPAATMQGYGNSQFISTTDTLNNTATLGGLKITVPAGMQVFAPVGAGSKKYTPVAIQNNAGPGEDYTIRASPLPVPGLNATQTLKTSWNITEATPGGNTIALTLQWGVGNEPAGFNRNSMKIIRSNGAVVVEKTGPIAATGANPYIATGGAFTGVSLFGATSDPAAFSLAIVNPIADDNSKISESISMYPTLVTGNNAKLLIKAPVEKRYLYVITDMNGKTVAKKELALWKGDNIVPVSLPALAKGTYIIAVYDGTVLKRSIKFVKG